MVNTEYVTINKLCSTVQQEKEHPLFYTGDGGSVLSDAKIIQSSWVLECLCGDVQSDIHDFKLFK